MAISFRGELSSRKEERNPQISRAAKQKKKGDKDEHSLRKEGKKGQAAGRKTRVLREKGEIFLYP